MSGATAVRSFVAIAVPAEVQAELESAQRAFERAAPGFVRWSPLANLHLTLYFLGVMTEDRLAAVAAGLRSVEVPRLSLSLGPLTYFPDATNPRVIAATLAGETERLRAWQLRVHDAVFPLAEHQETRGYAPHVTLGRLRPDKPARAKVFKAAVAKPPAIRPTPFTIDAMRLIASEPTPEGSSYRDLEVFPAK